MTDKSADRIAIETALEGRRKAIWLDADAANDFDALQEHLEAKFGFRPTPSQVLKYLLNRLPDA